jgi:hypothetical protein
MTKTYQIKTSSSNDEILERLKIVTIEEQPFLKPRGIKFLGHINNQSFKLITFHAPPMEFEFKVLADQIQFSYKKESLVPALKGIMYGLLIPLFSGFMLFALLSKDFDWLGRIFLGLSFAIIFVFCIKVYPFLYKRFVLPDDQRFLIDLKKTLQADIEEAQQLTSGLNYAR